MKRILLLLLFINVSFALLGQKRIERDTIKINGRAVGVTITNWYRIEGDKCPSFTVRDEDGNKIKSKDLLGKTLVISFWIKTCGPCMRELKRVGPELVDKYPADKFAFLAIGVGENAETAKWFRKKVGITFPLCYDKYDTVFYRFADNGFPKVFVVDSKGIIMFKEKGYSEEKFEKLKKVVEELVSRDEN